MDWGDFVYAVALARGGTLSAAARELRVNHVTIARRVARLEEDIGTALFDKTPDGYRLTRAGELVVAEGKSIERRLSELHLQVERFSSPTSGSVRVSALPSFFTEVLIPRLSRFRDRFPDIELTLDESATHVDLSRKQAEIALRSPKPKQPNLVCRRACRVANAMHASRDSRSSTGFRKRSGSIATCAGHGSLAAQPACNRCCAWSRKASDSASSSASAATPIRISFAYPRGHG
jgi:DNA-binding transcriptional LysR family regulator